MLKMYDSLLQGEPNRNLKREDSVPYFKKD